MSTITVDLERMLTSGKKNSYEGRAYAELVSCIARSKRVVCLTGAGISTSAGIPDFRSKDGLYKLTSGSGGTLAPSTSSSRPFYTRSPSSSSSSSSTSSSRPSTSSSAAASSLKGADLFSTQVFSSAASLSRFYRFISSLNALSESAKPTPTHRFMRTLSQKGKLLRVYTQNIDGLEEKVGLTSANPSDFLSSGEAVATSTSFSKGKSKFQGDLVHLHGRAALVRCTVCTYTGKWTDEVSQAYEAGYSMPCSQCQERLTVRKALGKRLNVAVGSLRPAITLYGEQGTEDLFISEISNADVRSRPDCLIIFGTSLKVHGFKQLAKDFAREVEENDGKVIYVNLTEPGKDWNSSIHYHVQGHTDIFVEAVLNEWRHTRPQDFEKQSKLSLSDFQPTKEKHGKLSTSKDGQKKSDLPNVKKDTIKVNREDYIARPVSPSKLRSSPVRRPRYEDDDDYIVSSVKSSKTDSSTKHPKQSLTAITSTPTSKLPSFERISTSPTRAAISSSDKKRKASTRTASDSDSCELRTEDEEEDHKLITRSSGTSSSHRTSAHGKHTITRKRTKLADKRTPRHSVRARDDFVISDSEQEGMNSNYDDIPLIAEMDSDDDEDTVYVQSSRTSSISKTAQRSLNKKSKSSAL